MGAFHDIWISNAKHAPLYTRTGTRPWKQKNIGETSIWESKPSGNDNSIATEIVTATHHLIILGQFYEQVETAKLLDVCVKYANGAASSFSDPSGHYLLLLIDKFENTTHVFTNRFGTYHAYWASGNNYNIISTYYSGIVKQSPDKKLDWEGITGFLSMGFFPLDKTYLQNVKIFQPASYYKFDNDLNLIHSKRYWDWKYEPTQLSTAQHLEQFDDLLKTSLSYSLKGKSVAIPVSGGLDSRTLAGVISKLPDIDNSKWAYSYGFSKTSAEILIAEKIAKSCNYSFYSYVVPNYLFDNIGIISGSVEQFQYVDGTRQACMKDELELRSELVVCGHWGDVWLSDMGVVNDGNSIYALMNAFRRKIIKKGSNTLLALFPENTVTNTTGYMESYFNDFMDKYKHIKDIDFRFKIFKTDQWSFRWTLASIRMYQAAVMPVLPFYDKNLTELFLQIPTAELKGRKLQVEYLKQYHPHLAKITWQEYNSNLYNYKWLNNRNIVYRCVNKIKRNISNQPHIIRNADIFYLNKEGRNNLEKVLSDSAVKSVLPFIQSQTLLDNYYKNPDAGYTYAVSMMHTFAQFIKSIS